MVVLIVVIVALLALVLLAVREQRLLTRAKRNRPATLEGGGSHLSSKGR